MSQDESLKKLEQRRREMMRALPTKEKLLEVIEKEQLLGEYLTLKEVDNRLWACDDVRQQRLEMSQQPDGSIRMACVDNSDGVLYREAYEDPSEGYYQFLLYLRDSRYLFEQGRAKPHRGKAFAGLLKRFFGK